MNRHRIWRISGILLLAVLLAGCGDKDAPSGADGSEAQLKEAVEDIQTEGTEAPEQQPGDTEVLTPQPADTEEQSMQLVQVNGALYYNTGETDNGLRCGMMDGSITSVLDAGETPSEDGQANFEASGYQWGRDEDTIEIPIDNDWYVFKKLD